MVGTVAFRIYFVLFGLVALLGAERFSTLAARR
jgi:hypothetical protein